MTAEEALKLSPTGFIWTTEGTPAYKYSSHFSWVNGGNFVTIHEFDWHPLPPSLREKQEPKSDDWAKLSAELRTKDELIAKLQEQLAKQTPKLKLKPLSEPPRKSGLVLIFSNKTCVGTAWYTRDTDNWGFYFNYHDIERPSYRWAEMPEVE